MISDRYRHFVEKFDCHSLSNGYLVPMVYEKIFAFFIALAHVEKENFSKSVCLHWRVITINNESLLYRLSL